MLKYNEIPENISEAIKYHKNNNIMLIENIFRYGSEKYFQIINEARHLYENNQFTPINELDKELLESDLGKFGIYEDDIVPLDFPMILEAEYEGREVELNKPKRGGSKKYYVYVKNPDSGRINKVEFGAEDGGQELAVKINDPEARKNFAKRHNCKDKKDKTTAGYWSCRLPKFAKSVGLSGGGNYWW